MELPKSCLVKLAVIFYSAVLRGGDFKHIGHRMSTFNLPYSILSVTYIRHDISEFNLLYFHFECDIYHHQVNLLYGRSLLTSLRHSPLSSALLFICA